MGETHHPTITRHDECWVVDSEGLLVARSSKEGRGDLPIGIEMREESELTAERLRENHAGR